MYCKKQKAILSTRACILRQNISKEKKQKGEKLTTFSKCFNCLLGKRIVMNPKPELDKDIRKLIREYSPKPTRYKLKRKGEGITKYKLMRK